jgi:hypothetical protein
MTKVIKHNFLKSSDLCKTSWSFPVASNTLKDLSVGMGKVTQDDFKNSLLNKVKNTVLLKILNEE